MGKNLSIILYNVALLLYLIVQIVFINISINPWLEKVLERPAVVEKTEQEKEEYFWKFKVEDFAVMLKILDDARSYVRDKESFLAQYEDRLAKERDSLDRLKAEIESIQENFSKRIVSVKQSEQRNLKLLASTYSNMEPEGVVKLFEKMDDESVVKVMHFIGPEELSQILQEMATKGQAGDKESLKRATRLLERFRLSELEGVK